MLDLLDKERSTWQLIRSLYKDRLETAAVNQTTHVDDESDMEEDTEKKVNIVYVCDLFQEHGRKVLDNFVSVLSYNAHKGRKRFAGGYFENPTQKFSDLEIGKILCRFKNKLPPVIPFFRFWRLVNKRLLVNCLKKTALSASARYVTFYYYYCRRLS